MIKPKVIIEIIDAVEKYYALKPGSILAIGRRKTTAKARALAMYLVRQATEYSYFEIAEYFDKDWSTVKYNCKKIVNSLNDKNCLVMNHDNINIRLILQENKDETRDLCI